MYGGVCYLMFVASEWYFGLVSFLHNMAEAFLTKVSFYRDFAFSRNVIYLVTPL